MSYEDSSIINKYQNPQPGTPTKPQYRILVLGTGGGGSNAVNHMHAQNIEGVELFVLNTDQQALDMSPIYNKLLLGPKTCRGLGAGGKPEVGRQAAEESIPEIEELLDPKPSMVFITAGMGGGTGTGAAPVVAQVVKSKEILAVGIVTIPFFFEGMPKIKSALKGAEELGKNVDALLVINNERLLDIYGDFEFTESFAKANDILSTAARSISEIITTPIMINIDMNDVDSTLRDGKTAIISIGYGEGEHRMTKAIQDALHSPLLGDTDIYSARSLLFAFYFSEKIDPPYRSSEAREINDFISDMNLDVKIIWGYGYDNSLNNEVKFTLLAAGFDVTVAGNNSASTVKKKPIVIEGTADAPKEETATDVDSLIAENYGKDKTDDIIRRRETQNYYILSQEDLDNDQMIDLVERDPAYKRNKRATLAAKNDQTIILNSVSESKKDNDTDIQFSLDDR